MVRYYIHCPLSFISKPLKCGYFRDKLGISDRGTPYQTFMILYVWTSVVNTLATTVIQAVDEDSR
jgi:hypothetical protein